MTQRLKTEREEHATPDTMRQHLLQLCLVVVAFEGCQCFTPVFEGLPDAGPNGGENECAAAGGDGGFVRWRRAAYDGGQNLYAISGRSETDVWAVGDGVIVIFDGGAWQPRVDRMSAWPGFIGSGIWGNAAGSPNGDYWITGTFKLAYPPFVWSDVWHWNGTKMEEEALGADRGSWSGVSGQLGGDVWAVATKGERLRFDVSVGGTSQFGGLSEPADLYAVWTPPNSIESWWAGGDGAGPIVGKEKFATNTDFGPSEMKLSLGGTVFGLWGNSATDIWAVGSGGMIFHGDGGTTVGAWQAIPSPTTRDLRAVWGAGANDIWAVGLGGTVIHWDGGSWACEAISTSIDLYGIWGAGPAEIWAAGAGGGIFRRSPDL